MKGPPVTVDQILVVGCIMLGVLVVLSLFYTTVMQ